MGWCVGGGSLTENIWANNNGPLWRARNHGAVLRNETLKNLGEERRRQRQERRKNKLSQYAISCVNKTDSTPKGLIKAEAEFACLCMLSRHTHTVGEAESHCCRWRGGSLGRKGVQRDGWRDGWAGWAGCLSGGPFRGPAWLNRKLAKLFVQWSNYSTARLLFSTLCQRAAGSHRRRPPCLHGYSPLGHGWSGIRAQPRPVASKKTLLADWWLPPTLHLLSNRQLISLYAFCATSWGGVSEVVANQFGFGPMMFRHLLVQVTLLVSP